LIGGIGETKQIYVLDISKENRYKLDETDKPQVILDES
jgi:hypothetical protein